MDCLRCACGGCSRLTETYYVGIQKYLLSSYCEKRAFFPPSAGVLSRPLSPRIYIIYMCARAPRERKRAAPQLVTSVTAVGRLSDVWEEPP